MDSGDLILMGPPGSGKGTQAKSVAERRGWEHLSTGDLFRDHARRQTELGATAKRYLDKGEYVPDELTVSMVRERLRQIPAARRIMFDGFPRTIAQAQALDGLLREFDRRVGGVILLEVPRDELTSRLTRRAKAEGRTDDTLEVIAKRLDVYERRTRPVIEHYDRRGLVRRVDGVGGVEAVAERLRAAATSGERAKA